MVTCPTLMLQHFLVVATILLHRMITSYIQRKQVIENPDKANINFSYLKNKDLTITTVKEKVRVK